MNYPQNLETLIRDMKACEQTPGINMLQHGQMVNKKFIELYFFICHGERLPEGWRIPAYFAENRELICRNLMPLDTISRYQTYHDCGKPYCRQVDENGRAHYPNHAKISSEIWASLGGSEDECRLMAMDMDAHTIRSDQYDEFCSRPEAMTLWITALCEIHANAEMFGGIESDSFKIKWKRLNKLGKHLFKVLAENNAQAPSA